MVGKEVVCAAVEAVAHQRMAPGAKDAEQSGVSAAMPDEVASAERRLHDAVATLPVDGPYGRGPEVPNC